MNPSIKTSCTLFVSMNGYYVLKCSNVLLVCNKASVRFWQLSEDVEQNVQLQCRNSGKVMLGSGTNLNEMTIVIT